MSSRKEVVQVAVTCLPMCITGLAAVNVILVLIASSIVVTIVVTLTKVTVVTDETEIMLATNVAQQLLNAFLVICYFILCKSFFRKMNFL